MARGKLRIYLGAAPGVGKTFAMLNEGRRRQARGTDVAAGFVETHGRVNTAEQIGDLEIIPRRRVEYRDTSFEEMDVDAVLARHPAVALVDELAHTNIPGSRNEKRWRDVEVLLAAGIDVISTVNVQHLESMNDVVEEITGIEQRETIPDAVVRAADQIELIDQTPEALRRRMAHGNIYASEKIDAALGNYFRVGNLGALRELALMWVADRVDEALEEYRELHGISGTWETRERVVVAITGAPGGEDVLRRAARMAMRTRGELLGVHVRPADGLAGPSTERLGELRRLLSELGGEYREISGGDVGEALMAFARAENASQLVMGASRRSRWSEFTRGSVVNGVLRASGPIDVHVISTELGDRTSRPWVRRPARRSYLSRRRLLAGWLLAVLAPPLLALTLEIGQEGFGLPSVLLLFLLLVVVVAAVGGLLPAVLAAVSGSLLANFYFTPPRHTFTIAKGENLLALCVFLVVAGVVSWLVSIASRRTADAARARAEAETLAALGGTLVTAEDPLPQLVAQLRAAFAADSVAVLRELPESGWVVEAATGEPVPARPEDASFAVPIGPLEQLAVVGPTLSQEDVEVLRAFAAQVQVAVERRRLRADVEAATVLAEGNELRTALLAAVSHDLRTPLASIKASVTSLLQRDVVWTPDATSEFLDTIDEETDRLDALVGNLLDMSRLQTGVMQLVMRDVGLEEIVPRALDGLPDRPVQVVLDLPETLPRVNADAPLLERAVANVVDNARAWSPVGECVRVEAGAVAGRVDLRVIDHGPGIPVDEREQIFLPFQRLGDNPSHGTGVGLGLAVARGFVDAMGGEVVVEDTPGGGATMVISLPAAAGTSNGRTS
ncbi:MAG TPA: sensor histidine kinase KdpD [Acidimicrobiia bacterium]